MSERLKSTNQVSNDEIIDDLTKDLKSTLNTGENPGEFVIYPTTSADEIPTESGDATKMKDIPQKSSQTNQGNKAAKDENETKSDQDQTATEPDNYEDETEIDKDPDASDAEPESDTDTIDETSLKDAEVDLTDDQKEERRIIAEELKDTGNNGFKSGDYNWSVEKYTSALQTCPLQFSKLRAILYCNRSAARMKQEKYDKAIKDCTKSIELDDTYLKAYVRRAQSYELRDKLDESLADYKKVLELDPSHKEAQKAMTRLPPLIEAKNEKLKTEMMGKLKDLGNMILKPFGLSTENFKMEQDPDTKGYKINFKQ